MGKSGVASSINQLRNVDTKKTLPNQADFNRYADVF
jgi:hypothetical protein